MPYLYDAHQGGVMISDAISRRIEDLVRRFTGDRFPGRFRDVGVWFRGQFCYVDVYRDPGPNPSGWSPEDSDETREQFRDRLSETPIHLLRLRYFGNPDRWSFAIFNDITEEYEPATFPSGEAAGRPEDALDYVLQMQLD